MNLMGSLKATQQAGRQRWRSGPGPVSYLLAHPACFHAAFFSIFLDASLSVSHNTSFCIPLQPEGGVKSFLSLACVSFLTLSSCSVCWPSVMGPLQTGTPKDNQEILFLSCQGTSYGHPGGQACVCGEFYPHRRDLHAS